MVINITNNHPMIIAKADEPFNEWEYTEAQRGRLYSMLNTTVYSQSKRKQFEYLIAGELTFEEYENFKQQFWNDRQDNITMKGTGNMTEIKRRIGKLK